MGNLYKSEKATWEGEYSGVTQTPGTPYVAPVTESFSELIKNIEKIKTEAIKEGLTEYYITQGKYGVHNSLNETDYTKANQKARSLCTKAKRFHKETVQNIDSKFTTAMSNTLSSLNKVNEGNNKYTTSTMTYEEEREEIGQYGEKYTQIVKKKYTLEQIIASKDSPIKAARDVYKKNLKNLKAKIKEMDDVRQKDLEKFSDEELMQGFFGSETGEFQKIRSSFHEKYGKTLGLVDGWGTFALGILAICSGPIGWVGLAASGVLVAYSGAKLAYGLATDESLVNGSSLGNTDKVLLAAGFLTSVLGFNQGKLLNSIIGKTGDAALTTGQTVSKWALTKGTSDLVGFATNPIGKIAEKSLDFVGNKVLGKVMKSVLSKVNFKAAVLNNDGLGTGSPRNVAKFSDLRLDEQAKMRDIAKMAKVNFTDAELLVAYQNVDFNKPNFKLDKPGVGYQDYGEIDTEDIGLVEAIKRGLRKYNSQYDNENVLFSDSQVSFIKSTAGKTVNKLSKDAGKEAQAIVDLNNQLETLGISEEVKDVILAQLYGTN